MDKDPQAKLDYAVDWTDWLGEGETITTSTWTVPDGLEEVAPSPSIVDGTKAVIWLAGGTAETSYRPVNHIVTSQGREDERSLPIFVRDR